jgi:hypothetical protein
VRIDAVHWLICTVSLGLDEADSRRSTLDVYRKYFEVPFIIATKKYYQEESRQFLAENSVVEYMKKVCIIESICPLLD